MPGREGFAAWLRLLGRLGLGVLPLLFCLLPFTAFASAPAHDLLGGMFVELQPWQVFLVVLPLVVLSWSALTVLGLHVEGSKLDPPALLPGVARVFDLPPRGGTFVAFPLIGAAPGAMVMVVRSSAPALAALAALAAGLLAYAGAIVIAAPLSNAQRGYDVVPGPLARMISAAIGRNARLGQVVARLRGWATRLAQPPFEGAFDPATGQIDIDHFVALGFALATVCAFALESFFFRPWNTTARSLPSAAVVFTLGTALVWIVGALSFHLRRYDLPPAFVLIAAAAVGYLITQYDHHFHVITREAAAVSPPSPIDVARGVGAGNLVVVTTTGGGIQAAGWTTHALAQLTATRPALAHEIRLISGVSGGAVGTAFYLDALRGLPSGADAAARTVALHEAHTRAVTSSLDALAYGLVFLDFARLVSGDLLFSWTGTDRASLLENRWRALSGRPTISVHDLGGAVRAGELPATIFGVTAMESGQRVMITPVAFGGNPATRAPTLDEYLLAPAEPIRDKANPARLADLDLWTAARLSGTFPFVLPAARAMIDRTRQPGAAGHHMLDGGYSDNFGVASALDFLAPVMAARKAGQLGFRRLLIIQLRSASTHMPAPDPAGGFVASVLGPLLGILNVREGATLPRNAAALDQFIQLWNGVAGVAVTTIVFEPQPTATAPPEDAEQPLSWHLTETQKRALLRRWSRQPDLDARLRAMQEFLGASD
jgi:hypothetical protein